MTDAKETKCPRRYNVIGSEDSTDIDITVVVSEIPEDGAKMCEDLKTELEPYFSTKDKRPLNVNIATVKDGIVTWVYKGSADENNNGILATYHLHKNLQEFPCIVEHAVKRDVIAKVLRGIRGIIGSMTRTETLEDKKKREEIKAGQKKDRTWNIAAPDSFRTKAKNTLRGNLGDYIRFLKKIDFTKLFPIKDIKESEQLAIETVTGNYKRVAFQLAQTIALLQGIELYTKAECVKKFSELKVFLMREKYSVDDMMALNKYTQMLVSLVEALMKEDSTLATIKEKNLVQPKKKS